MSRDYMGKAEFDQEARAASREKISHVRVAWIKAHASHEGGACLDYPYGEPAKTQYLPNGTSAGRSRTPINLMCDLAHGQAPTGKPFAVQECGNDYCIHPKHLKWMSGPEKAEHFQALRDEGLRDSDPPGRPRTIGE